jgi:hypothetical protein
VGSKGASIKYKVPRYARNDGALGTERGGRFLATLEMSVGLDFLCARVKYKVPRYARNDGVYGGGGGEEEDFSLRSKCK